MRRSILFILIALLSISAPNIYAAVTDTTSPYNGEYLLAINTSTDGETSQSTGNASILSNDIISSNNQTPSNLDIVNINDEGGSKTYQMDAKDSLKKATKVPNSTTNTYKSLNMNVYPVRYVVGSQKTFVVTNFVTQAYEYKIFTLKYSGNSCNIWLENSNTVNLTDLNISDMGNEFDNDIYSKMTDNFGPRYDKDSDGKVAIILYDINDGFNQNTSPYYYGGFFDSADLDGYNNNMDVLHVDTYPSMGLDKNNPTFSQDKSTIVHEYQHLINYSDVLMNHRTEMPVWLNEGLSMAAEHMMYGVISNRISYYNSSDAIRNGHSLLYWDYNGSVLANYSLSYLFVQYLRTQTKSFTNGGTKIYKSLIQSSNGSPNEIENVMKQFFPTITLQDILINFRIATVKKDSTGPYSFMGETDFNSISTPLNYSTGSISLRGGGAIIKYKSTVASPTSYGSDIKFVGFTKTPLLTPASSLQEGTVNVGSQVALSGSSGASIRYTTDGSIPTSSTRTVYQSPIVLTKNETIKAISYKDNSPDSDVSSFTYNVLDNGSIKINPIAIMSYGLYNGTQKLLSVPSDNNTYTVKAQYVNTTGININPIIALYLESNKKLLNIQLIKTSLEVDQIYNLNKDINLPSAEETPNLEIMIIVFDGFTTLRPMSDKISIER